MRVVALFISLFSIILFGSAAIAQEMVRLVGNHPANPPAAGVLEAPADMRIGLSIGFAIKNRPELDTFLQGQHDPSSHWYHQALRKDEFAKRFGPTATEYRAVLHWLKNAGFEITSDEEPKMYVWCIGTVAQAETAFQIKIVKLPTGAYWNVDDPAIPGEFSGLIESIVGLDNLSAIKQEFKSSSGAIGFGPPISQVSAVGTALFDAPCSPA
jgi:subtilase family serine protease